MLKKNLLTTMLFLLTVAWFMIPQSAQAATCETNQSGDWNNPAIWTNCGFNIVPGQSTNDYVIIKSGHTVDLTANPGAIFLLEIENGATFNANSHTLTISSNGGSPGILNNGTFNAGTGLVLFNNAYGSAISTIAGSEIVTFNDITASVGVDFAGGTFHAAVNGLFTINAGGFVSNDPPTYNDGSTLHYNSDGNYGRGAEWSATSGPGYPHHVQISNNTILNYPSGAPNVARAIDGDLTIDTGSALYMDFGAPVGVNQPLTVAGNVALSGALSLGDAVGGDMFVGGDWVNNGGTFIHNNRLVTLTGSPTAISGSSATTFAFLTIANTADVTIPTNTTVSTSFVNNGTIRQIRDVNGNSDITFLDLNNYGGMIINAVNQDLGETTVTIRGNQTACDTNDTSVRRCFDINATNNTGRNATITFFWHSSELGNTECSTMNAYHWSGGWSSPLTLDGSYGSSGRICTAPGTQSLRVTGVSSFSPFAMSSGGSAPTAVTMQNLDTNAPAVSPVPFILLLLLTVVTGGILLTQRSNQPN